MSDRQPSLIRFPGERKFAFTVFDDTDNSNVENIGPVYRLLTELGMRTTKSVWILPCSSQAPFGGATLQDCAYLDFIRNLKQDGFEIAIHNVRNYDATREEVRCGLDEFDRLTGELPRTHANHAFNRDNLYWGSGRLNGEWSRRVYRLATHNRYDGRFTGHVEGSPYFWGDLCQRHITYVRNFVFGEINLNCIGAAVPYRDPAKPFVNYWFSSCEGANVAAFCDLLRESSQDYLESESGISIVYTHFAEGFVENGRVNPRFEFLLRRLVRKKGWFVPVSTLLDFLRPLSPRDAEGASRLARSLERRWLVHKLRFGSS
jgi:hypothetical protein